MKIDQLIHSHADLQDDEPFLLIVRHAEKNIAKDFHDDRNQAITNQGQASAKKLGIVLWGYHQEFQCIKSSPVGRCVQTGTAIAGGLNFGGQVLILDALDSNGVYVHDVKLAQANFINNNDAIGIFKNMLNGMKISGMNNIETATNQLLFVLLQELDELQKPGIYITHDSILALFTGNLLNCEFSQANWFDYLEGIAIKKTKSGKYMLYWNEKTYDITKRCQQQLTKTNVKSEHDIASESEQQDTTMEHSIYHI